MLEVYINNKKLALPENVKLSMSLKNALFDLEQEDASYPLDVPLEPNREIFGDLERATKNVAILEYPALVRFAGIKVFRGVAKLLGVTSDQVELCLTIVDGFYASYGSLYLDELDLGNFTFQPQGSYPLQALGKQSYFEDSGLPIVFAPVKNAASESALYEQINRFNPVEGQMPLATPRLAVPFLYLQSFIEIFFESSGWTIIHNDMDTITGFDKIYILHALVSIVDDYDNGYSVMYHTTGALPYNKMLPHITVRAFLEELKKKFKLRFIFDDATKEVAIRFAGNINSEVSISPTVLDGIKKTFLDVEIPENMRFFDAVSDKNSDDEGYDASLAEILDFLCLNTAAVVTQDTETESVECISRPTKTETLDKIYCIFNQDASQYLDYYFSVPEYRMPVINSTNLTGKELIFAIFDPLTSLQEKYTAGSWQAVPPLNQWPVWNSTSQLYRHPSSGNVLTGVLSLLWSQDGVIDLYNKFQRQYYDKIQNNNQEHEFVLRAEISMLRDLSLLFYTNCVIKGKRYAVSEQEITLSRESLSEWRIIAVPL